MTKGKELKKIEKKNQEVSEFDFLICPNCGETEVGKFCPSCGQSNKDYNKPIKEIVGDLLDSISLDIRLLNTLIPFFFKPGFLTQEYFNGRRKKYVPPMRMYMFFSIVFFFLAQYATSDELKNNFIKYDDDSNNNQIALVDNMPTDTSLVQAKKDSVQDIYLSRLDKLSNLNLDSLKNEVEKDTTNTEFEKELGIGLMNASENKDLYFNKFLKNLSYVLFLLMPFFALILAMVLWKSKMLYVKHLIFSINFHSFIFGISSVVLIIRSIFPKEYLGIEWYLLCLIPIYLMIGIKRFYDRRYVGAFFKTFGALTIYTFILLIAVTAILVYTAKGLYNV